MDDPLKQLDGCLRQLLDLNRQLLEVVAQKQKALAEAQPHRLQQCVEREKTLLERIGRLEVQRQEIVSLLSRGAGGPKRLSQIAEEADEPVRGRLLVHHKKLRELLQQVRTANDHARRATEGLIRHMRGVVQMVHRAVNVHGTYGRQGMQAQPAAAPRTFTATG
ncbi:MAG: flagellar protein FlgN [Phycisphaeraceae bacterium]|nr:flagellar protein FlgN [Phycisphaeraceae bacterium]